MAAEQTLEQTLELLGISHHELKEGEMGKLHQALASKRRTDMLLRKDECMSGSTACMLARWQAR